MVENLVKAKCILQDGEYLTLTLKGMVIGDDHLDFRDVF